MRIIDFIPLLLAASLVARGAQAQTIPVAVEAQALYAHPIGDWGNVTGGGAGWSAGASFSISPGLAVYGRYVSLPFEVEVAGVEYEGRDEGWSVGARSDMGGPDARVAPWLRAGAVFREQSYDADLEGDTKIGYEVEIGAGIRVGPAIQISPTLGFSRQKIDYDAGAQYDLDVFAEYATAGITIRVGF